jgi:hypothetical protein
MAQHHAFNDRPTSAKLTNDVDRGFGLKNSHISSTCSNSITMRQTFSLPVQSLRSSNLALLQSIECAVIFKKTELWNQSWAAGTTLQWADSCK